MEKGLMIECLLMTAKHHELKSAELFAKSEKLAKISINMTCKNTFVAASIRSNIIEMQHEAEFHKSTENNLKLVIETLTNRQ